MVKPLLAVLLLAALGGCAWLSPSKGTCEVALLELDPLVCSATKCLVGLSLNRPGLWQVYVNGANQGAKEDRDTLEIVLAQPVVSIAVQVYGRRGECVTEPATIVVPF